MFTMELIQKRAISILKLYSDHFLYGFFFLILLLLLSIFFNDLVEDYKITTRHEGVKKSA